MTLRKDFEYSTSQNDATQGLAAASLFIDIYSVANNVSIGFKAFIKSFSDSLKLNWNIQEIGIGRMDPLVNFKNLERVINIGFSVPAADLEEAKLNFSKLQTLQNFLYPNKELVNDKDLSSNVVAPPLIKLLFMNWIKDDSNTSFDSAKSGGLLGYLDGISFNPKPEQDNYFFDSNGNIYPSNFEISFNFYVLNSNKEEKKVLKTIPSGQTEQEKFESLLENKKIASYNRNPETPADVIVRAPTNNIDLETTVIKFINPAYDIPIIFSAFIKDFNDKFTSNWNKSEVFGKTDKLATFKNTSRKINFSFSVPSKDQVSAMRNYNRMNNFLAILYPAYDKNLIIKNVPYTGINFLNWISSGNNNSLFGVINDLQFKPDIDSGFYYYKGRLYPTNFEVSIDFTVLHTKLLGAITKKDQKDQTTLKYSKTVIQNNFPYNILNKYFEGP